jgi:hypothetical protein
MVLCGFGSWRWVINRLLGYPLAFPEPNAQHGTGVLHFPPAAGGHLSFKCMRNLYLQSFARINAIDLFTVRQF